MIYETAVFCGRTKEWRILNLNTATIYTQGYETQEEALASIIQHVGHEHGCTVSVAKIPLYEVHRRVINND